MMRRALVAALCGAALIATPVTMAYAQPDTQPCRDATALVVAVSADVDAATLRLNGQVRALDDTRGLLAVAVESAKPYFRGEVARLEGVVAALRADLAAVEARLAVAVTGRDTACADPTTTVPATPTPDPSAPATTTPVTTDPAPTTTTPVDEDEFDQVGQVPSGSVATGA